MSTTSPPCADQPDYAARRDPAWLAPSVGGPVRKAWREGTLTRATELAAFASWLRFDTDAAGQGRNNHELRAAIAAHIEAAREATKFSWHFWRRDGWRLERAMSNLDAAEVELLNVAPASYVLGQMPSLVNDVQRHLEPADARRLELERIARKVGVPQLSSSSESNTTDEKEAEVERERGKIVSAVRGARSAALRQQTQVRSFRNVVVAVTVVLTLLAIGLAAMGWRSPTLLPLCFEPTTETEIMVVCPTGESEAFPIRTPTDSAGPTTAPGQTTNPTDPESPPDIDAVIGQTARRSDILLVEILGLTAAAIAAAAAIRRIRGSSEPYSVPVALALLKLPTGAITALLGLLLMRGEFVPGLSALDSSAQILSWGIVFGYAQQLFTRFVDQQGDSVLDNVRSSGKTPAADVAA